MNRSFLFQSLFIIGGAACGIAAYLALPDEQVLVLEQHLAEQMHNSGGVLSAGEAALRIFRASIEDMLRFFLAGLCLIGIPVLCLLLFGKGFTFGFAACFLLRQSVWLILPRLLCLPVFILAAGAGVRFSGRMLLNRMDSPLRQLAEYTVTFGILLALLFALSLLDGVLCVRYITPAA